MAVSMDAHTNTKVSDAECSPVTTSSDITAQLTLDWIRGMRFPAAFQLQQHVS